jgi:hypothetical protein
MYDIIRIVEYAWYDVKYGCSALVQWAGTVWKWRWWDFDYSLQVIKRDLELKYKYWDQSHYVGAEFTKKRIKVMLNQLDEYNEEYDPKKQREMLGRFLRMYARNLERLWD